MRISFVVFALSILLTSLGFGQSFTVQTESELTLDFNAGAFGFASVEAVGSQTFDIDVDAGTISQPRCCLERICQIHPVAFRATK